MRILSLHINGFGKLCDFPLEFDEKLTCISKQNGYGKTTIAAFIRAMFYSMPTARKGQSPENNPRIKYLPWSAGSFGGRLTFSIGAKIYTIIRNFDRQSATSDEFQLIDTNSGKPTGDFTTKIGEELFGVDEDGFFRSTFSNGIPDLSALPASIRTRLSSENENAEDMGQFGSAKKKLDDAIKQIKGKNGRLDTLAAKIRDCQNELGRCETEIAQYHILNTQIEEINGELKRLQAQKNELEAKLSESAGAEAARIKLENYNKLKEEIEQLKEIVSELEKRYGGKMPTESQIETLSDKITELSQTKTLLLSETERSKTAEFAECFNRFKENLPTDEQMSELSKNAKITELAQSKIDELSEKIYTLKTDLECMHIDNADKIPSDAELSEYRSLAGCVASVPTGAINQSKTNPVLLILSCVLALSGVGIAFVNFTLGIVIAAVFAVVLVALLLLNAVKKTVSMGAGAPVSNEDRQKVQSFLKQFGFSSDIDVNVAVDKLKTAANLKSEIELTEQDISLQRQNLAEAKDFVNAALEDFQISLEGSKGLQFLVSQREKYINTVVPTLEKIRDLKAKFTFQTNAITALFEEMGVQDVSEDSYSLTLEDIKKDLNDHENNLKQLYHKTIEAEENFEKDGISEIILDQKFESLEQITQQKKVLEDDINELYDRRAKLEASAKRLSQSIEEHNTYSAELENCIEQEAEEKRRLSILEKTLEFLLSAKTAMTQKYAAKVEEAFKKYSQGFIAQNLQNLDVSPDLELSVKNNAIARETDFFSSGERGVMDVCLRLALVDSMFKKEKPFLILDDPFSLMDKENLSDALALVKEAANDKQIIYFTCHQSREIN